MCGVQTSASLCEEVNKSAIRSKDYVEGNGKGFVIFWKMLIIVL